MIRWNSLKKLKLIFKIYSKLKLIDYYLWLLLLHSGIPDDSLTAGSCANEKFLIGIIFFQLLNNWLNCNQYSNLYVLNLYLGNIIYNIFTSYISVHVSLPSTIYWGYHCCSVSIVGMFLFQIFSKNIWEMRNLDVL